MTAAGVVDMIRGRISIKNPAIRDLTIEAAVDEAHDAVRITLRHVSPGRDDGQPQALFFMHLISVHEIDRMPDDYVLRGLVADIVRQLYLHEFQECFHIDGVRVFDPHAEE